MRVTMKRGAGRLAGVLAVAMATTAGLALSVGTAHADNPRPALRVDLMSAAPAVVRPGGTFTVSYRVRDTVPGGTRGVLFNIWLPPHVTFARPDPNCGKVGTNADGGDLISCKVMTDLGFGKSVPSNNALVVAKDAPAGAQLGSKGVGLLVVPLDANKNPTEDFNDLNGPNVGWTQPIKVG
jgi:hypothetical protein